MEFPENKIYVDHQSRDRVRHEIETLFGLLVGYRRHSVTLDIYDYERKNGHRDLRDSVHHLVALKEQGLSMILFSENSCILSHFQMGSTRSIFRMSPLTLKDPPKKRRR